jgi:uncharacterized membrane protein YhdT
MKQRRASLLAWSLAGLSVILYAGSVPLYVGTHRVGLSGTLTVSLGGALFLVFPVVGGLVSSRRPRNPLGWVLLADGLVWNLSTLLDYYSDFGVARPGSVPFVIWAATINNWLWVPAVGLLGTYAFLLFPDGKLPSRRWQSLAWLSGIMILLVSIQVAITPGNFEGLEGIRNPLGNLALPWISFSPYFVVPPFLLCMVASVLSLVLRFRRSMGEERQQIKWIAFAASLIGLLYVLAMIGSFVYPQETWFAPGSPLWLLSLEYAALLSFPLVPIAIGFAMLRYRLYDIDVVINRALVYGSLTVTLALVYLGGVAMIQALFRILTGQEQQPQLAVVISTLAIAALFNPLRKSIQAFIDRRFYRKKYDAAKTLEAFSGRLRNETDLDALGEAVLAVVRESMQPEHATLWLRQSESKT